MLNNVTKETNSFIFDFDSTIVTTETLDDLIKSVLPEDDHALKAQIDETTHRCMNGEISFNQSITTRLSLAHLTRQDFHAMAIKTLKDVTEGIDLIIKDLLLNGQNVFIVSGGFMEVILPTAELLGIPAANCFANTCLFDENDTVIGLMDSPLAHEGGKIKIIQTLKNDGKLPGKIIMIGDGMSDFSVLENGYADSFIGCGFNACRPSVLEKAPHFAHTIKDLSRFIDDHTAAFFPLI